MLHTMNHHLSCPWQLLEHCPYLIRIVKPPGPHLILSMNLILKRNQIPLTWHTQCLALLIECQQVKGLESQLDSAHESQQALEFRVATAEAMVAALRSEAAASAAAAAALAKQLAAFANLPTVWSSSDLSFTSIPHEACWLVICWLAGHCTWASMYTLRHQAEQWSRIWV
jgi:hypothetical protein